MTTKKGHQILGEEKCTPRENPGYAYAGVCVCLIFEVISVQQRTATV